MDRRRLAALTLLAAGGLGVGTANASAGVGPADFADYIAAFNRHDFDGFSRFYDDHVLFEGRGRRFETRQQVVDFYRMAAERLRESIVVRRAYFGQDGLAAELETTLAATRDWPDFFGGPLKAGDVRRSLNFVFYAVRDARFIHIRSANFKELAGQP